MDPISIALGLAQFAPSLIKYFTGSDKASKVAEQVIGIAQTVTGKSEPEQALKSIQADPVLAIQFQTAVMENDAKLQLAFLADVQDARKRDTAIHASGHYNWRADVLAFLAVGGLVICVWFIARQADLAERAVNAIMFVAGVLASAVRDVYGFEFGSSRSSQTKDITISNLTK